MRGSRGYEKDTPIKDQQPFSNEICIALLSKWVEVRIDLLQIPAASVPTNSTEEFNLVERLARKFGSLTPRQFADAIRDAAYKKQQQISPIPSAFPRLYGVDIEEMLDARQHEKNRKAEADSEARQLPRSTQGNAYWGTPSEALKREWPAIATATKKMRAALGVKDWRVRFWSGGNAEQREAARAMIRQMITDMERDRVWDAAKARIHTVELFQKDFIYKWPNHARMVDKMEAPLNAAKMDEIKQQLNEKLVYNKREPSAANINEFPDLSDLQCCTVFDFYWNYTQMDA